VSLVREQVASTNGCLFCMDASRYYALKSQVTDPAKFDALVEYRSSPLFNEAERAALDYASELTKNKEVAAETFDRLARCYSEREICDIVWLVASEHLANMANIGLNIGSSGLCDMLRPHAAGTVAAGNHGRFTPPERGTLEDTEAITRLEAMAELER